MIQGVLRTQNTFVFCDHAEAILGIPFVLLDKKAAHYLFKARLSSHKMNIKRIVYIVAGMYQNQLKSFVRRK